MRRFPVPWSIEALDRASFKIVDANGQSLAYVYGHLDPGNANTANGLTLDEARRIASGIAKLPKLAAKDQTRVVTLEEKRKYLGHLMYEVGMLHYCYPEIVKRAQEPGNERNVYIECFALHARALYEFLIRNSPRKLNVVAQDFVADFQPTDAEGVSDIIQKIHDQILHMGWKRTTDNALKFDVATEGEKIWNWLAFWSSVFWVSCRRSM